MDRVETKSQFQALMQEVLAGSEVAAEVLFRNYEAYLLRAIRERLSKRVRSKFDSVDIAQDVWKSFFASMPAERSFGTPKEFLGYLAKLARHKVIDATRARIEAQKRNVAQERSLDDSVGFDKNSLMGADRTPSQILMSHEEWQKFLGTQPLVYRRILVRTREGRSNQEIADELGISVRTVERVIRRFMTRTP